MGFLQNTKLPEVNQEVETANKSMTTNDLEEAIKTISLKRVRGTRWFHK